MDNKALPLPDRSNYQYGYQVAYRLVCEQLVAVEDLEQLCQNSGSQLKLTDGRKAIILRYLGKTYQVSHPDINVSLVDSEETVALKDKVLILHYLNRAKGTPVSGRAITSATAASTLSCSFHTDQNLGGVPTVAYSASFFDTVSSSWA